MTVKMQDSSRDKKDRHRKGIFGPARTREDRTTRQYDQRGFQIATTIATRNNCRMLDGVGCGRRKIAKFEKVVGTRQDPREYIYLKF
jgi:hypothetical protein